MSSAREEILQRIRTANANAGVTSTSSQRADSATTQRDSSSGSAGAQATSPDADGSSAAADVTPAAGSPDLVDLFVERTEDYKAVVESASATTALAAPPATASVRVIAPALAARSFTGHNDSVVAPVVAVSSIAAIGVLGLLLQDWIETDLRSLWLTATMLLVFALVIMAAERVGKQERELTQLTWRHGLAFGFWQALALVPGVSRSGGTIAGGLFMGYTREAAARYSFLLAIPAVLASGGLQVAKVMTGDAIGSGTAWGPIWVATGSAFDVGYAVIAWFMRYITTHTFTPFMIYRIVLALVLFALLGTGVLVA